MIFFEKSPLGATNTYFLSPKRVPIKWRTSIGPINDLGKIDHEKETLEFMQKQLGKLE